MVAPAFYTRFIWPGQIAAGFPSPAEGFEDQELDLHAYLVERPAATFFFRVAGDSMRDEGILDGAVLVVDRSLAPAPGRVAVTQEDGGFVVCRLTHKPAEVFGIVSACVARL